MKYSDLYIRVMDISLNLARVGNWTADNYERKRPLISRFLGQADEYLAELLNLPVSDGFNTTLMRFSKEYSKLRKVDVCESNKYEWSERALTWANILQHRAKLA